MRGWGIFLFVVGAITLLFGVVGGALAAVVGLTIMYVRGGSKKSSKQEPPDSPDSPANSRK